MIYVITFLAQLIAFLIADFFSYLFLWEASFCGHNQYMYYIGNYGILRSDYNGNTMYRSWYRGKYNALFRLKPIR